MTLFTAERIEDLAVRLETAEPAAFRRAARIFALMRPMNGACRTSDDHDLAAALCLALANLADFDSEKGKEKRELLAALTRWTVPQVS